MDFEVKETIQNNIYRLIMYSGDGGEISNGIKLQKKDLYSLYILLHELFNEE